MPAAWRKMCVSSATGTAFVATSSANGLPAPTGASWSASPTSTTCMPSPTARSSVTSSSRLAIDVSSTTSRSASISSRVGPWPGIQPSAEWIVDASMPVDSAIRRAARPVGATSAIDAFCALAAAQMSRIVAVLPVPGPPVTIETRDVNAASTAAACSGAGVRSSVATTAGLSDGRRLGQPVDEVAELDFQAVRGRPVGPQTSSSCSSTRSPCSTMSWKSCGVGRRGVEQRRRPARQLGHREAGGAFALGLDQHVHDRRRGGGPASRAGRRRRGRSCPRSGSRRRRRW